MGSHSGSIRPANGPDSGTPRYRVPLFSAQADWFRGRLGIMSSIASIRNSDIPFTELDSAFATAPVGMLRCFSDGAVESVNPALLDLLDLSFDGLKFSDLLSSDKRKEADELLRQLFAQERDSFEIECEAPSPKSATIWIRCRGWRIRDALFPEPSAFVLVEDVSELREVKRRLQQSERLESVGRLAGGVAHDFNNLLTGVLLYCDLLVMGMDAGSPLRKYADEIRGAGMQASGLVRQLLSIARPSASTPQFLSLNEIAQGMRTFLSRLIGERIDLQMQLDPCPGWVRLDPTEAQQILLNLVLNARDAMPQGGVIRIATANCRLQILESAQRERGSPTVPCATLSVSDSGIGMDAYTREHLFEAFFTTKPAGKGTGLGLATVHDVVARCGGLIQIESEPGQGTRVTVILPLLSDAVASSQETQI